MENLAILVPLKAFSLAKSRLRDAGIVGVDEMARSLAEGVILAARPRPLYVTCESPDVALFARDRGAQVIRTSATNLNEAVTNAYRMLSTHFDHVVIAPGDLRDPQGLGEFEPTAGVTIFTDAHRRGTNVLALPTGLDFNFHFGADSAPAHAEEAQRLRVHVLLEHDSPWSIDIDRPQDLVS
ncbi:MAG: hypothetical protein HIU57_08000 [Acidobacteria bacterium]|nr:hypothetical protein [Acidobacteriota bacterium]